MHPSQLSRLIDAAQGRIDCDLILKGVSYLDVFSCQWRTGDLAIIDGKVVGIGSGLKAKQSFSGKKKWVVPGFIDAHVHVESSMMTPRYFQEAVLTKGTTTAICDPHELANVMGVPGIEYFLNSASHLAMNLRIMLSSCVPATKMETNGAGEITSEQLMGMIQHPKALGLAEMMNMPGVIHKDPEVLKKLVAFSPYPMDGHCPLMNGTSLSAYAATGISSCHESSGLQEAQEKLTNGISIWIREGSVAKDIEALIPLLNLATSTSIGFCTDDRNPLDIAKEGHIDYLVRRSIQLGIAPEIAFRTASWSVARHYRLNFGPNRIGAIAPGYGADLVILDDLETCSIQRVLKDGHWADEIDLPSLQVEKNPKQNSIRASIPEETDLEGPEGLVHVIGVLEGKIITDHRIKKSHERGIAKLAVLERYGHGSKPANGYVEGFGLDFQGAIASSVGHDSHNLIAVGSNTKDMRVAMASLAQAGGGFCVVKNGAVLAQLDLPLGGLMSEKAPLQLKADLEKLKDASRSTGCTLREPFLQLAFLSLPVIPSLKLTDQGLVDVNEFKIIDVRAV